MSQREGKPVTNRVRDSFADSSRDDVWAYLLLVTDREKELAASLRRTSVLVVLLTILFELLARGDLETLPIGGSDISASPLVLASLPPLLGYFFLVLVVDTTKKDRMSMARTELFRLWNEQGERNDLDTLVEPIGPLIWQSGGAYRGSTLTRAMRVENMISMILLVVVVLGYLAYEVRMFVELRRSIGASSALFWLSLLVEAGLLLAAFWSFFADDDHDYDESWVDPDGELFAPGFVEGLLAADGVEEDTD